MAPLALATSIIFWMIVGLVIINLSLDLFTVRRWASVLTMIGLVLILAGFFIKIGATVGSVSRVRPDTLDTGAVLIDDGTNIKRRFAFVLSGEALVFAGLATSLIGRFTRRGAGHENARVSKANRE
jgi:hypothetical protein